MNFIDFGLDNDFFGYNTKKQETKAKINNWIYVKLKILCTAKEITNKMCNLF